MRILACADIHMGRKPENAASGHSSWDAIIDRALLLSVDLVVLVGDVVEQENAWLSVYGPLLTGLDRLKEAGIKVVGVGGNHDWSVFPRLAKDSDAIKILGLGGVWEPYDIGSIRLYGWSFPENHENNNPISLLKQTQMDSSKLSLGLLHADVGQVGSPYAPIQEQDLRTSGVDLWMLGHIHKSGRIGSSDAYYCGSPYALDGNEMGRHGVYLLETEGQHVWKEPTFISLCPYRYEKCEVDVSGIQELEQLKTRLTSTVRQFAQSMQYEGSLYIQPIYTGTLAVHLDLAEIFGTKAEEAEFLTKEQDIVTYLLGRYEDRTEPEIDLVQVSQGSGADALLAGKILDPITMDAYARAYQQLSKESYDSSAFNSLQSSSLGLDDARSLARQAAMKLLRAMALQKEGGSV